MFLLFIYLHSDVFVLLGIIIRVIKYQQNSNISYEKGTIICFLHTWHTCFVHTWQFVMIAHCETVDAMKYLFIEKMYARSTVH